MKSTCLITYTAISFSAYKLIALCLILKLILAIFHANSNRESAHVNCQLATAPILASPYFPELLQLFLCPLSYCFATYLYQGIIYKTKLNGPHIWDELRKQSTYQKPTKSRRECEHSTLTISKVR